MNRMLWYLLGTLLAVNGFAAQQPNIILILMDDQDFYDLGYHGNPVVLSRYQEGYHLFHDSLPEGWMLSIDETGLYRLSFEDSKKIPLLFE